MPHRSICAKATFVFNEALIQDKIELFSLVLKFCLQCEISIFEREGRERLRKVKREERVHGQEPPGSFATQNVRVSGQASPRFGLALIDLGLRPWHPRSVGNPSVGLKLG